MKYHNFKRSLAIILASLLTFSSATFVASAQETGEENQGTTTITYTFRGESSEGDGTGNYTVEVLANGGLINTGFVEITYDADLYSGVTFTPAQNIKDASFYWDVDNKAGTFGVGFMSAANLSDEDAGLFADVDNPSNSIAYIKADGEDLVRIGTFTLTFAEGNSYATAFTTANAEASAVEVKTAKYILHAIDGYDTTKYDAEKDESTMLVFSADDFEVSDIETTYNGEGQAPTVESDFAEAFTLALDGALEEATNAGTYAIKVKGVSGKGYYEAAEIDLGANFVINRGKDTVDKPEDPASVPYKDGGIDVSTLEFKDWDVTDTGMLGAGTHPVNIEFIGDLDENIDYTAGTGVTYDNDKYTATVSFVITPLEGTVPDLETEYSATYDAAKTQTIKGYDIAVSEGWAWSDDSVEIGMTAKDVTVNYTPSDTKNYDYSKVEGWDGEKVVRTVSVILAKATGKAPEAPVVIKNNDRLNAVDGKFAVTEFVTPGDWTTTTTELGAGSHAVTYVYTKDIDTTHYTYATAGDVIWEEENSRFTYTVTITVDKPYIDVVIPPVNPDAKPYRQDESYSYGYFTLNNGWIYAEPNEEISAAGEYKDVKVLYLVSDEYDIPDTYTVETIDGKKYIVSAVTLTISKIDIPADCIKFAQTSPYTGSEIELLKSNITITGLTGVTTDNVTLVAVKDVNVGKYDVFATIEPAANYNAITEAIKIGTLEITAIDVKPSQFKLEYATVVYDGNVKMPKVTADEGIAAPTVKYYGENGDEVAEPKEVGTYTVKVSGAANGNYNKYDDVEVGTFEITKFTITIDNPSDPAPVDYVDGGYDLTKLSVPGWKVTSTGTRNAGTHPIDVVYDGALDVENNKYIFNGEEVTSKEQITAQVSLVVNKIALPADAYTAEKVETSYDGKTKEITVVAGKYTGVGTYTVAYTPEAPVNAGTYSATITVAEGENYLGGTVTLADVLVITKQVLQNISAPTFNQTEAIVGDVISGDAGEGFTFVESYTIKEGNNEIKVTKTIAGSFAKNYDYTEAAAKVGLTVTIDETTGDVTLSKTFNVTGKYSTGTLNLTINTSSEQTEDKDAGDVTITILPEGGEKYNLTSEQFTEAGAEIKVSSLVLTEGKYTITVKKQRYLAYVITLNITANATTEQEITLVAGDIVGGVEGSEVLGDGVIDIDDFVIAIRAFDEASNANVKNAADIDESGVPNVADLSFIKNNFNKSTANSCTLDLTVTE